MALAAWKYGLPEDLKNGQIRSALTAVMKNMFSVEGNFDNENFLKLGFVGHQPNLANYYTNNGSLYMTFFKSICHWDFLLIIHFGLIQLKIGLREKHGKVKDFRLMDTFP